MSTHRSPTRRHHWSKRRHPDWYHLNKQVSYLPWMYWVDQCCHQVTKDVGELTCRQSDPSSDGQKKNHLPMEGPMLGFSACVYHSRFITPFGFYMWKYLKLHFTVWILHTYLCLRKSTNPKDNQSIFFRIRHFIQRSFSRHECVNSRKERRNCDYETPRGDSICALHSPRIFEAVGWHLLSCEEKTHLDQTDRCSFLKCLWHVPAALKTPNHHPRLVPWGLLLWIWGQTVSVGRGFELNSICVPWLISRVLTEPQSPG